MEPKKGVRSTNLMNEFFSQFFLDALPEAMLIIDFSGRIHHINTQAEKLFEYHHDELVGREVEILIPKDFRKEHVRLRGEYIESPMSRHMNSGIEFSCKKKSGEEFQSDISLSPLNFENQNFLFCSIRDITSRFKTRTSLAEKVAQLEAINDIGLAVSSTLDIDNLLSLIVEQAAKLVGAESCAVLLPDEKSEELVFKAALDDIVGMRVPLGKGVVSHVLSTGEPEIINDVSNAPGHYKKINEQSNLVTRSLMAIPLLAEGRSLGVLTATNKIDGDFSTADCELLVTLASYAATSLQNTQLYEQIQRQAEDLQFEVAKRTEALRNSQDSLQQRNLELNRLYRASETLFFTSAPELEEIAKTIVNTILAEFGKSNCSLLIAEKGKNMIRRVAVSGPYAEEVSKGELRLDGTGLVPRAFRLGKVVNIPDVRSEPDYVANWKDARSELAIPLKLGEEIIGVIDVQSAEPNAFNQDDVRLMGIFAERAALAIENVRLFEAERRQRVEAETLREASSVVAGSLQQDEAINEILVQLKHVVAYDSASVQLLGDGYLEIVGGRGWPDAEDVLGLRFPVPGDNPNSDVIERRQAIILDEASQYHEPFLQSPHSHIRSWMGVPLVVREKIIGMLAIDHTQSNFFTSEHIRMVTAFADQVAITIDHAQLFEKIQSSLAETRMLYDISRTLIKTDNLNELLQGLVDDVAQNLPSDRVTLITFDLKAKKVRQFVKGGSGSNKIVQADFDELFGGLSGWVLRESKPALSPKGIPDPRENDDAQKRRIETHCGSIIVAPMFIRDRAIGTITAINKLDDEDFTQREVNLLEAIAGQAAIAIENANLLQKSQTTLAETQMLYQVAHSLIQAESLDEVLQSLVDNIAKYLPAYLAAINTFDLNRGEITNYVLSGMDIEEFDKADFDELMDGLTGWAVRELEPAVSPKGNLDPRENAAGQKRRTDAGLGAVVIVPLVHRGNVLGSVSVINRQDQPDFVQRDIGMLETVANQAAIAIENAQLFEEIQWLATTDGLTGTHNRRHLFELGRREIERARRYEHHLSAIMLDIDNFKQVNDTYGHSIGDQVLRTLTRECIDSLREVDIFGRYGGEEFAIILPETDRQAARKTAERLRKRIERKPFLTTKGELSLTISLGVAALRDDIPDMATLLDLADSALYVAKQSGRNRVEFKT